MVTSYFFVNFATLNPSLPFVSRTVKFNMVSADASLILAPSAAFLQRSLVPSGPAIRSLNSSLVEGYVHTPHPLAGALTLFTKKLGFIASVLKRRSFVSQLGKVARVLAFTTLCTYVDVLSKQATPRVKAIPTPNTSWSAAVTGCYWFQPTRIALNIAKSPKRFALFWFATFVYCPMQSSQGTGVPRRQWLFLPRALAYALFLASINLNTPGLAVRKLISL